jgi:hypothetical protein
VDVRRIISTGLLSMCLSSLAWAQWVSNKPDNSSQPPSRHRDSFLEYTLKQMNPSDTDYGSRWDKWRTVIVERTLQNGFFWSNLIAIGLLICLFLIIVCERNNEGKRAWAVSEVLAQYEHALTRANAQILDLTSRNHELAVAIADSKEQAVKALPNSASISSETTVRTDLEGSAKPRIAPSKTSGSRDERRPQNHAQATETGKQIALFTPEVDLMMTVNSLRQQLAHSEQRNTILQRRAVSTSPDQISRKKPSGPKNAEDKSATI